MEYNKRKFAKANDKKVLHKIKKQWVVVSLSLLAALGLKALATTNVSADTATAAGDTNAKQTNSSQSKSNVRLVNSQVTGNQQNNGSITMNHSAQGRQSMQSSVSSASIMKNASDMHNDILRNAMTQSSSANADQAKQSSQSSSQSNSLKMVSHQLGATASTPKQTSNNNKRSDQSDSTIMLQIVNNENKNISGATNDNGKANGENDSEYQVTTVPFNGKYQTTYSLHDIWNAISNKVPGYHLSPVPYSTNGGSDAVTIMMPAKGKVRSAAIYVQGDKVSNPITVNINERINNSTTGVIPQTATLSDVNVGDSIDPREFLNEYEYAPKFEVSDNNGDKYTQQNFTRDANSIMPVRIQMNSQGQLVPVDLNGVPYPNNTITFDYHLKSLDDQNTQGLPIVITRYFDRDIYNVDESPSINLANNRQALHSTIEDMFNPDTNTGSDFNYLARRDDIPSGYFYVSDIKYPYPQNENKAQSNDPTNSNLTVTKFGPKKSTENYNIRIAKDARLIYQDPSDGYKVMNVTMLQNMEPDHNQLSQLMNTNDDQIQNYGTNRQYFGGYQIPSGYTEDSINQSGKAYTASKSTDTTSTISDGGTYYINLHRQPTTLTINYVNADWRSDVVASTKFNGKYNTQLNNSDVVNGEFPNAKYVKDNIKPLKNGQKWSIPSYLSYPGNNKTLQEVYSNRPYYFHDPTNHYKPNFTVNVPVGIQGDSTLAFVYVDSSTHKPVDSPIYYTNKSSDSDTESSYSDAISKKPLGYNLDSVANNTKLNHLIRSNSLSFNILDKRTIPIYVESNYINGYVDYIDRTQGSDYGHTLKDKNNNLSETVHQVANTPVNYKNYYANVPFGYHVDLSDPIQPKQSDWVLRSGKDNKFNVNVIRNQGTIIVDYYVNSDYSKPIASTQTTMNFGDNYDQDHDVRYHMPKGYQGYTKKVITPRVHSYGNNTTQYVKVDLDAPKITGHIRYWDPSDKTQGNGGSYYPVSSHYPDGIPVIGNQGDPINYGNYPQSDVMVKYLPKTNDYTYKFVSDKPGKLEPGKPNVYDITIKRIGKINVHYIQNSDFNNSIAPTKLVTGENGADFNWENYIKAIPNYQFVKILHNGTNSVNNFSTTPQDIYLDFTKVKQVPNTPTSDNGTAVITYIDVDGDRVGGLSKTGRKNEGISNSVYTDNLPSGYIIDHYDNNNENLYNGNNNIIWVKTPVQSSSSTAPSSSSSTPSSQASPASNASSTSQQGTITVQYQNSDGTPIKQTMSQSDVGHLFDKANLQNRPAPAGYHWTLLGGNNVGYYQSQPQQVTLRLVHDTPQPSSAAQPSSSAAPQSRATKPVHHTRGNIGVTYEGAHGNVLGKKSYHGDVGAAFMPNTTPKRGYHFEIVRGNNVNEFKDHKQNVVMKLVKNQKSASTTSAPSSQATPSDSTSRNYGGTSHSASSRTPRYGNDTQVNGVSHRRSMSSFDHALDQEVTMAHHHNGKKLPQTGEGQSDSVEAMGMILLAISAVFIAGYDFEAKRRRHN